MIWLKKIDMEFGWFKRRLYMGMIWLKKAGTIRWKGHKSTFSCRILFCGETKTGKGAKISRWIWRCRVYCHTESVRGANSREAINQKTQTSIQFYADGWQIIPIHRIHRAWTSKGNLYPTSSKGFSALGTISRRWCCKTGNSTNSVTIRHSWLPRTTA